jgi:LysM repeat protein
MKNRVFSLILTSFLLITLTTIGQKNDYPIKKLNGVEYYVYTVQVSEGLFAIGRKFDLLPAEISKVNPEIEKGIKAGQKILIPIPKQDIEKKTEKRLSDNNSFQEFIQHMVEKKQTLFAISHIYNVSQEDLKKYNPQIENGLTEGVVLKIPKFVQEKKKIEIEKPILVQTVNTQIKPAVDSKKKPITHQVQSKETLYSISKLYKVQIVDLIKLNPGSDIKLTIGAELKIPADTDDIKSSDKKNDSIKTNSKIDYTSNGQVDLSENSKFTEKKVIRIAYLLPFMLDSEKKDPTIDRFFDFYAGALIAINEAKQKGISFEILTYDTEKSELKMIEVLSNPELKTMDLIIGPAFSNQISLVEKFAKENQINTLIPFTSKVSDIDSNPYLFQFNPGVDTEIEFITDFLTRKQKKINVIFAEIQNINSYDEGKIWADKLQNELTRAGKLFSKIEISSTDSVNFATVLKKGDKNLVIFNTDKFAYINPMIKYLRLQNSEYDIVLFEQYSWRNQSKTMPLSIYISPFIIKNDSNKLKDFNEKFTQFFSKDVSVDSPRYDLLGYDLSDYFISLLHLYAGKFPNKISSYNYSKGIQSQPQFERTSNGSGFINQRLYLGEDKK